MNTPARFIFLVLIAISFASPSPAKSPNEMSVLDCYLALPQDFLNEPPSTWLHNCGVIDEKGGYMRCQGDGAQPNFEVLLLHYTDGRPLLVICQGQLNGDNFRFLDFFEVTSAGQIQKLPRTIFPVTDGDQNENKEWYFILPHPGHTIVVRKADDEKVLHKLTWNGEKFVDEK